MNRTLSTAFALAACLMAASPARAQDSWSSLPWTPAGFCWHGGAELNGKVYLIGGYDSDYQAYTYEYDPVANAWTRKGDLPLALWSMNVAGVNGTLYCIGGADNVDAPRTEVYSYDAASGTWSGGLAPMPGARLGAACGVVDGRIYIAGGQTDYYSSTTVIRDVQEYDPSDDSWRRVADLPVAIAYAYFGSAGGQIVVAGGLVAGGGVSNQTFGYDPVQDQWHTYANMPTGGATGSAAAYRDRLYCQGGPGMGFQNLEFSVAANRWTNRATIPFPLELSASVEANGRIYITASGYHYAYTPPDFGANPSATNPVQHRADGSTLPIGAWVGATDIQFSAIIDDGDGAAETVRLEVEVREISQSFSGLSTSVGAWTVPGPASVMTPPLPTGSYQWRVRPVDLIGNAGPWIGQAAGTAFTVDQVGPSAPIQVAPGANEDVRIADRRNGPVTFAWSDGGDNSGVPSAAYEVRIDGPGGPVTVGSPVTYVVVSMAVSANLHTWAVRAVDGSGNWGAWSPDRAFRVVYHDLINHAGGDAGRVCGGSASSEPSALFGLGIAVIALAALARRAR